MRSRSCAPIRSRTDSWLLWRAYGRLATQPRILLEDLGDFLPPEWTMRDFVIATSRSLWATEAPSVLLSKLSVMALIVAALGSCGRMPLFGLAVLLFFAGHLIGSSAI